MTPFPETIDPTRPLDTDIAAQGAAQLRALKQYLADVFGLMVSPTQQAAGAMVISSSGVITVSQAGATVPADPTANLGIATKQYVDNSFLRLYKTNLQVVPASTTPESALVVPATSNQRWHLHFGIYTNAINNGFSLTVGVSGPSGASYNLGSTAVGAQYGASPSLRLPYSLGNYFEFELVAYLGVTGGNVTLTYSSEIPINILAGSILIATQVTGA